MALLTKAQAAARLGVSEKTVSRFVERGKLKVAALERPVTGGKEAPLFDPKDVDQLADAKTAQQVLPSVVERSDGQVAKRGGVSPALRILTDAMARAIPLHELPVLTIPEAARLSHFPEHELRAAISSGVLPSRKVGRGVKVWRADLDQWLEGQRPGSQAGKPKRH